jgi:hypothetical protein
LPLSIFSTPYQNPPESGDPYVVRHQVPFLDLAFIAADKLMLLCEHNMSIMIL